MPRPKHTKPDANQAQIIHELRTMGFEVIDVSRLGGDALDLFVMGFHRQRKQYEWLQVEVKTALDAPFTTGEKAYFAAHWNGSPFEKSAYPIIAATSAEEIAGWFWAVTL